MVAPLVVDGALVKLAERDLKVVASLRSGGGTALVFSQLQRSGSVKTILRVLL